MLTVGSDIWRRINQMTNTLTGPCEHDWETVPGSTIEFEEFIKKFTGVSLSRFDKGSGGFHPHGDGYISYRGNYIAPIDRFRVEENSEAWWYSDIKERVCLKCKQCTLSAEKLGSHILSEMKTIDSIKFEKRRRAELATRIFMEISV
jgi:hypothetical protein